MKKRIGELLGVAVILCAVYGGVLAGTARTSSQHVGVPVSDAVASTLVGGACFGCADITCEATGCAGSSLYQSGSTYTNSNPAGPYQCNTNSQNCGVCYKLDSCRF